MKQIWVGHHIQLDGHKMPRRNAIMLPIFILKHFNSYFLIIVGATANQGVCYSSMIYGPTAFPSPPVSNYSMYALRNSQTGHISVNSWFLVSRPINNNQSNQLLVNISIQYIDMGSDMLLNTENLQLYMINLITCRVCALSACQTDTNYKLFNN